ncbi:hypothetical protein CHCC14821_2454 [Bacillus paralicheniformis]|nr:hypothetical protein CHCC14821_2454 [Bacillus paralicheniformis]
MACMTAGVNTFLRRNTAKRKRSKSGSLKRKKQPAIRLFFV